MDAPFTVSLEREEHGRASPIPMPVKPGCEDLGPGKGFNHDDVRRIGELILQWAGGGTYIVTVTSDNGATLQFRRYYNESFHPPKMPPPMVANSKLAALAPPAPQAQVIPMPVPVPVPQPQPQPVPVQMLAGTGAGGSVMSSPNEWVNQVQSGVPRNGQPHQQQTVQQVPMETTRIIQMPAAVTTPAEENRVRDLEQRLQTEREERLKREAQHEREKLESNYRQQLDSVKDELRRLAEKPTTNPIESDVVRDLRAQIDEMKNKHRDDGQNTMMQMFMQMMNQMNQQNQQNQQQMQQLILQMSQKPAMDPMVTLILENSRQQAEAYREQMRQQAESQRESARNALGPRDLVDLTEKMRASSGVDSLLKSTTEAFQNVFQLQRTAVEMMKDVTQGPAPHPALEMLGQALQGIQSTAQGYFEMKKQAAVADARARAVEAQSRGALPAAPPGARPAAPQGAAPPQPEAPVAGNMTPHEQQLFGLPKVLEYVEDLRKAVKEGRVTPEQCVGWVQTAHSQIVAGGMRKHVRVFDLFENQMYDDFVRALIPDAPQAFIIEFVNRLSGNVHPATQAATQAQTGNDEDEDENEDE